MELDVAGHLQSVVLNIAGLSLAAQTRDCTLHLWASALMKIDDSFQHNDSIHLLLFIFWLQSNYMQGHRKELIGPIKASGPCKGRWRGLGFYRWLAQRMKENALIVLCYSQSVVVSFYKAPFTADCSEVNIKESSVSQEYIYVHRFIRAAQIWYWYWSELIFSRRVHWWTLYTRHEHPANKADW